MSKKTAIITGSSSGFGLLCALELAKHGFKVVATMRDINKSTELEKLAKKENILDSIQIHRLDVTSTVSILEFKGLLSSIPTIDVLVNNAGFAVGGFCEEIPLEDYRSQFNTNFFGVISVTQAVLPFMRKQRSGKIINMSSISGRMGFPGLSPYVSSKFALEGFSESLRLEVRPFGIDVVLMEPGSYKTNIWSSGMKISSKSLENDSPYHFYMKSIQKEMERGSADYGDPTDVAKLVANVASQRHRPTLRYPIGKGVKQTILLKNMLSWKTIERLILKQLLGKE